MDEVQYLDAIIRGLVDTPSAIRITKTVDERGVLLTLDVDSGDMGKVIGKGGDTAKAVRTLLRIFGMKNNARINLKINEPEGSTRPAHRSESAAVAEVDAAMKDLGDL